jgi:hypothetical protein
MYFGVRAPCFKTPRQICVDLLRREGGRKTQSKARKRRKLKHIEQRTGEREEEPS